MRIQLGLLTLAILGIVGCANQLKAACLGGDQTICSYRFGNVTEGSVTYIVHEIDVPAKAKTQYEIFACSDSEGCETSFATLILDCRNPSVSGPCIVVQNSQSQPINVTAVPFTDGKTIRAPVIPDHPEGNADYYKVRVTGGSLITGTQMQ